MKRTWSLLQAAAGLVLLAALALGLVAAFRAVRSNGLADAPAGTQALEGYPLPEVTTYPPTGYPPPPATLPPPEATAIQATFDAEATMVMATMIAEMTASAPPPLPTPGPIVGPQTIADPVNHFSLNLLSGWRASVPSPNALAGVTDIVNYDVETVEDIHGYPLGGLKIQIGAGKLPSGQSFDQWLSDWLTYRTIEFPGPRPTPTEPIPYQLGSYEGVTFTRIGLDYPVMEIALPLSNERVMSISLVPADSPALEEALSMLSTLEVSP
jgi:hypothetical protein